MFIMASCAVKLYGILKVMDLVKSVLCHRAHHLQSCLFLIT